MATEAETVVEVRSKTEEDLPEVQAKRPSLRRTLSLGTSKAAKRAASVVAAPTVTAARSFSKVWKSTGRLFVPQQRVTFVEGKAEEGEVPEAKDEPTDGEQTPEESQSTTAESPEENPAMKVITDFTSGIIGWASAAGLIAEPEPEPEPEEPKVVEAAIVKHGVPWRGSYERLLVIDTEAAKVVTLDPETRKETNAWLSPRDLPKAISHATDDTIELFVAPWPEAPGWLHQRLRFSFATKSCREVPPKAATIKALEKAGVAVEAC